MMRPRERLTRLLERVVGEAARRTQLTETLKPTSLELVDDSAKHAGHAAMRGTGATESHFQYGVASRVHVATDTERDHRWARVGPTALPVTA